MSKSRNFKVGDRVRVEGWVVSLDGKYIWCSPEVGNTKAIIKMKSGHYLDVELQCGSRGSISPRQVTHRLIKKKKLLCAADEVPVSRKKLAEAWNVAGFSVMAKDHHYFKNLCQLLELPEAK